MESDGRGAMRRSLTRWRIAAVTFLAVLIASWGWMANRWPTVAQADSAAAIVAAAADQSETAKYATEQQKAELRLLRKALASAKLVDEHHRHHSQVMWDLLQGKITSQEAWWQGGDSTCAGWLAANEYEKAVAKLEGRETHPPPIPRQGLEFCRQARERR